MKSKKRKQYRPSRICHLCGKKVYRWRLIKLVYEFGEAFGHTVCLSCANSKEMKNGCIRMS